MKSVDILQVTFGWDEDGAELSSYLGQTETVRVPYRGEVTGRLVNVLNALGRLYGTVEVGGEYLTGYITKQDRVALTYETAILQLAAEFNIGAEG